VENPECHAPNQQVSNDGATAKKAERDAYVDTLRCKEPVVSGAQRFRIRIDAVSGEDFCNHIGFAAGEGYKGSALNSTDSCCIEVDSGRISVDGRSTGASITRPPAVGDVVVVEIDLDRGEFSGGIEGEAMTSVQWAPTKVPVFLAVSFRRLGWKVTVLGQPKAEISKEEVPFPHPKKTCRLQTGIRYPNHREVAASHSKISNPLPRILNSKPSTLRPNSKIPQTLKP
jgi:hypothetical protein